MHKEFSRWGLALVIIAGLFLRVGFVAYEWDKIAADGQLKDPDDYGRLALNLVQGHTFGYPIESAPLPTQTKPIPDGLAIEKPVSEPPVSDAKVEGQAASSTATVQRMRPTAYRPPLYPALLTPAAIPDLLKNDALHNVRLNPCVVVGIHIFLGMITIGLVYYIAWRLDYRSGWIPALAVTADPILLFFSGQMMTETLVTMLAVWAWALYLMLVRPNIGEIGRRVMGISMSLRVSLMLGLVLGLAVLTRPTMLPWAVLMIASLSLRGSDAGNRVSMITAALIVMSLINAAWMLRNRQQLGQPVWTTTHGGYTLLLANNPPLYKHFKLNGPDREWGEGEERFHKLWAMRRSGDPRLSEFWEADLPPGPAQETDIDELKDDRLAQEAALATIKSDPATFAKSCLYRAGWLWAIYPNVDEDDDISSANVKAKSNIDGKITSHVVGTSTVHETTQTGSDMFDTKALQRLLIGTWYGVWFVMAGLGLLWLREALTSRVWFMPLLLILTLTAIHMIYWSNMRMRAPMMPVVYMLACWPLLRTRTPSGL